MVNHSLPTSTREYTGPGRNEYKCFSIDVPRAIVTCTPRKTYGVTDFAQESILILYLNLNKHSHAEQRFGNHFIGFSKSAFIMVSVTSHCVRNIVRICCRFSSIVRRF